MAVQSTRHLGERKNLEHPSFSVLQNRPTPGGGQTVGGEQNGAGQENESTRPGTIFTQTTTFKVEQNPEINASTSKNIAPTATQIGTSRNTISVPILVSSVVASFVAALGISILFWFFCIKRRRDIQGGRTTNKVGTGQEGRINVERAELDGRQKFEIDGRERNQTQTVDSEDIEKNNAREPHENVLYELEGQRQ